MAAGLAAMLPVHPALADHTMVSGKVSLERYLPRIQTGLSQLREIRDAVKAGDLAMARRVVEDITFDQKLRRALNVYATSFSDSFVLV
jgi:hypothetical protein